MNSTRNLAPVPLGEHDQVSRNLLFWLNQFPEKPVVTINYEYLDAGQPDMALSTIQGAYKTRQYIMGGYQAQYQFKVIYRIQPGDSNDSRLDADELLNRLGSWATTRQDKPDLGEGIQFGRITADAKASMFARYENGDEDHQILMTMTYEVI